MNSFMTAGDMLDWLQKAVAEHGRDVRVYLKDPDTGNAIPLVGFDQNGHPDVHEANFMLVSGDYGDAVWPAAYGERTP